MKKILLGVLFFVGLCSFRGDEPPEPAIKNGAITPFVAYAYPFFSDLKHTGMFNVGGEYQISRGLNVGVQYSYFKWHMPLGTYWNQYTGTRFHMGDIMSGHIVMLAVDYCYLNRGRVSLAGGFGLGKLYAYKSLHVIDSIGISSESKYPRTSNAAGRIRLIDAKVQLTKNFGVNAGLGLGSDGLFAVGAHYVFTKRE